MAKKSPITAPIEMWELGKYGIIHDMKPHLLPPEAFTNGQNVRFTENGVERFAGHTDAFGDLSVAPYYVVNVPSPDGNFWIYCGLDKVYAFDGATHSNITRQTASVDVDYTTTQGHTWQSTILGGVPIFNNGTDVPQYWTGLNTTNKLADLTAWPSTLRAKVVKALGPYLAAFNLNDNGSDLPKTLRWSSFADPGTLPASWDISDPTVDCGQLQLTDSKSGGILDLLLLGNVGIIYTDTSTHTMKFVGGIDIFSTDLILESSGILSSKCATSFKKGTGHAVLTQDDVIIHAGTKQADSIIDMKDKKFLFNNLDSTNFANSFSFENPSNQEVWFCFPSSGSIFPNIAAIWNYRDGTFSFRDIDFNSADIGTIFPPGGGTWEVADGSWGEQTGPWGVGARTGLIAVSSNTSKAYSLDAPTGAFGDNTNVISYIERVGLAIDGKDSEGKPKGSLKTRKLCKRIWPKLSSDSVPVTISVGSQQMLDGPITWSDPQSFDPTTQKYLDVLVEGLLLAYRIEATGSGFWKLEGVDFEVEVLASL